MSDLNDRKKNWEQITLARSLAKAPEQGDLFETLSWIPIERLYTPLEDDGGKYTEKLGFPGEFPYTRGIYPTMYRGRLWTMRMFCGFGTCTETNERFKYLLSHGETGLSTAFDMPTLMGVDSDHPLALGEVGRCGVAVDTMADMEELFDGIDLEKVSVSMTINGPAAVVFAMYLAAAEKRGFDWKKMAGTIQNDILKEYLAQREWIYPPEPSVRLVVDTIGFCAERVPQWHPVSISGYHIREAGSTAVQELAFTLYDGLTYVQSCVDAGMDVDSFAPRLSFFFDAHNDFFEEIAKLRAARRLWATEMKRRFNPKHPHSLGLRFHTQTAGCSLTAQQPLNNVARVTIQALAAVLGGTQSLHTDSMDETYSIPTEEAARTALRTQQIIAHESGVANTVDPLGGSYFVEALTDRIEAEARKIFETLDGMGGMVKAIEQGWPQAEMAKAATRFQEEVDAGKRIIVGLNAYQTDEKVQIPVFSLDPEIERRQVQRVRDARARRDQSVLAAAIARLRQAAGTKENLMPYLLDCVRAEGTVGEISNALKEVFGVYRG
ncbi:MAG: methylmalonyl-CoA mutase family protein [Nitrospirota bacterium]|nr:methylmalonyl-CoA mutase family protein [Nitrospirota bacterium]